MRMVLLLAVTMEPKLRCWPPMVSTAVASVMTSRLDSDMACTCCEPSALWSLVFWSSMRSASCSSTPAFSELQQTYSLKLA